ncbi:DUF2993 domain-containing protein [Cryptosporangium sp. NPDC051539]|uniref:DUF2993 domain-containing protein n=1 Tax=Cryptosporangium sp. NPDC051539 TaxID=3363962 RepID=UPI00379ACEE6
MNQELRPWKHRTRRTGGKARRTGGKARRADGKARRADARRGRRRPIWAAATVAVLVLIAFAADRVAETLVTGRISDRLACAAKLGSEPQVDVAGPLFLPQLLRSSFQRVDVRTHLSGTMLGAATVDATLRDVSVDDGSMRVGAVQVTLTADVSALAGRSERISSVRTSGGQLFLEVETGFGLPVTLIAEPKLTGRTLSVEPTEIEVMGVRRPAGGLLDKVGGGQGLPLDRELPELPDGLSYRSAEAVDAGLRLTVTGHDLNSADLTGAGPAAGKCAG